ncbi:MAG: nucleotidyl transferase AbiEii/AbiGii toxin family protein [Gemmatimonadaceae bacterium]
MPLNQPTPVPPEDLPPVARAVLEALRATEGAQPVVGASLAIGGGVGLKHYLNLRPTHDLDLWWTREPESSDRRALEAVVAAVAKEHGYVLRHQSHGDVTSIAFVREDNLDEAEFAVEVATRDVQLAPYGESAWSPVLLESLEDNVASKMVALVSRGYWRDFADIYAIVSNGLTTNDDCWALWARKQQGLNREPDVVSGKASVLRHLEKLSLSRPIERFPEPAARARAATLRAWFKDDFTAGQDREPANAHEAPRVGDTQSDAVPQVYREGSKDPHVEAEHVAEVEDRRTPEP